MQEKKHLNNTRNMVEGRAPHRAEAFVAMRKSEDRSLAVTTLHTTRHGNRAVARYNQIPGERDQQKTDWTRKPQGTNREAGRTRGGTLPGGNEPIRSNPKLHKKHAQNNRGRHKQHPPKAKTHTQHHRTTTGKRPNQITTDAPGTGRAGRLTRAPTHNPETSGNENGVHSKDRKPTRQPRRKVAKSQNNKGRGQGESKKGGEYLVIRSVLKKVLLVRFEGSSLTIF